MRASEIVLGPVVSEKSTGLAEVGNRFVFRVDKGANKIQIRDAVQRLFKVRVREVRTLVVHGKLKRAGQVMRKRPNWKKAIVSLAEGQKIEMFK